MLRLFLDTNALNALAGLSCDRLLCDLRKQLDQGKVSICVTHVQVDERIPYETTEYQERIERAISKLKEKEIPIQIEPTEAVVVGISRLGLAKLSDEEVGRIFDELRERLTEKEPTEDPLNLARDAMIAFTSLRFDHFVSCDRNLAEVAGQVFQENKELLDRKAVGFPDIVYVTPIPSEVAKAILRCATI